MFYVEDDLCVLEPRRTVIARLAKLTDIEPIKPSSIISVITKSMELYVDNLYSILSSYDKNENNTGNFVHEINPLEMVSSERPAEIQNYNFFNLSSSSC